MRASYLHRYRDAIAQHFSNKIIYLAVLVCAAIVFYSCRKGHDSSQETTAADQSRIEMTANQWLDRKKVNRGNEREQRVEQLRQNLVFSDSRIEKAADNETVMIIPVNAGFTSVYNTDKNPRQFLLLTINIEGKVKKGNIVQLVSESPTLPANTFYSMDTDGKVKINGSLTFLSIFDRFLFTVGYKNGRQISFTEARKKNGSLTGNPLVSTNGMQTNSQICTDWWLITTYYYDDGSTEVFEDYLGRTCVESGGCLPNEWCEPQPEDPGSGGGETPADIEDYDYQTYRLKEWKVHLFGDPSGYAVYSWENIRGKRDTSSAGGYIKSASHHSDECNKPGGVWGPDNVSVTHTTSTVSSSVSGKFWRETEPDIEISGSASWSFSEIF